MGVLIVGMHRSGTSALVRVLESMGFYAGGSADFNLPTHDPLDYREHRLVWGANETALAWVGKSWNDPVDVDWELLVGDRRSDVLGAINHAIAMLNAHRPWVAKDPRLCLTLPLWRLVSEPTCIITHRNPLEIGLSLRSRDEMPVFGGIALWEAYQRSALLHSQGLTRIFVRFSDMVDQHGSFVERLATQLRDVIPDLTLRSKPFGPTTFDFSLIRQRRQHADVKAYLNPAQLRLLEALDSAVAGEPRAEEALAAAAAEPLSDQAADVLGTLADHRQRLNELKRRDREISEWNDALSAGRKTGCSQR